MPEARPRLRRDLIATPFSEEGFDYVEVRDDDGKVRERFYAFEHAVARQLDGRPLSAVAVTVRSTLGLPLSVEQLEAFVGRLEELGLLEKEAFNEPETQPSRPRRITRESAVRITTPATVKASEPPAASQPKPAAPAQAAPSGPIAAPTAAGKPATTGASGSAARSADPSAAADGSRTPTLASAAGPVPLKTGAAPSSGRQAATAEPITPGPSTPERRPAAPPSAATKTPPPLPAALRASTALPPASARPTTSPSQPLPSPTATTSRPLGGDDGDTTAVVKNIRDLVAEAERTATASAAAPPKPTSVASPPGPAPTVTAPPVPGPPAADAPAASGSRPFLRLVSPPPPEEREEGAPDAAFDDQPTTRTPRGAGMLTWEPAETSAAPTQAAPPLPPQQDVADAITREAMDIDQIVRSATGQVDVVAPAPPRTPAPPPPGEGAFEGNEPGPTTAEQAVGEAAPAAPPPPRRRASIAAALGLGVAGALGLGVYLIAQRETSHPIAVRTREASPTIVYRYFETAGVVRAAGLATLSIEAGGRVVQVSPKGTKLSQGEPAAVVEGGKRWLAELTHLRERLTYYEETRERMRAAGNKAELRQAELKVAEKQRLIAEARAELAKMAALAPSDLVIEEPLVTVGAQIKPGTPVVKLVGGRPQGVFPLSRDERELARRLAFCRIEIAGRPVECEPGTEEVPDDAPYTVDLSPALADTAGNPAKLARTRYEGVFAIPTSALVEVGSTVRVYVATPAGRAEVRAVALADRTAEEAVVTQGLDVGDAVIVNPPRGLAPEAPVTATAETAAVKQP